MSSFKLLLYSALLILSSCGVNTVKKIHTPILGEPLNKKPLLAEMRIKDTIRVGQPLQLVFIAHNTADSAQQFCNWHTPFEPLISKYLEVKDESGIEVLYRGPMAKRMMPPPQTSYIKINKKDSLSKTVELLEGYDISRPAKYTITYTGQNMSGLEVKESVSFVYVR